MQTMQVVCRINSMSPIQNAYIPTVRNYYLKEL